MLEDKYQWLEDILGPRSLQWAKQQNKRMVDFFSVDPTFEVNVQALQKILESKEKIPFVQFIDGGYVYNTWTDDKNVQGLIRRVKIEEFKNSNPQWEILIDLDLLSKKDGQKWVSHGIEISPNKARALVFLSPGGSDADIVREFDLESKKFVEHGFELPVSKGGAFWFNDDEILLERDFGLGTLTTSGYPRTMRKWSRGQLLESSEVIFETSVDDVGIWGRAFHNDHKKRILLERRVDFYAGEILSYEEGAFKKIDLPNKMDLLGENGDCLFVSLREDWKNFLSGDVVVYNYDSRSVDLVYRPQEKTSVYAGGVLEDGLLLVVDVDVKSKLYFFKNDDGLKWVSEKIDLPDNGSMNYLTTGITSNDFFISYDSFNAPITYFYGRKNRIESVIKNQPGHFDFENIEVSQHFAISLDKTQVPYFLVHKKGIQYDGTNPTILYGYGGFEISLKPRFNNLLGHSWLDKGGVYVLANIRGGGEYGPSWHQSALKENRDLAYQDFFAIAEDLIAKKITSPQHLGAKGGSNGGLLMGVCFTQRPDLFRAINCGVPLLDMRRYHTLLAGHSWVAEYGDPDDELDGKYIRNLSPYHRIEKDQKNYPIIFLNTSTKDDRVHPAHARKFAAKLEEFGHEFFYYENIDGGHAGASNLKELAFVEALDYAFFWKYLK